jgi:hypothetical protein
MDSRPVVEDKEQRQQREARRERYRFRADVLRGGKSGALIRVVCMDLYSPLENPSLQSCEGSFQQSFMVLSGEERE